MKKKIIIFILLICTISCDTNKLNNNQDEYIINNITEISYKDHSYIIFRCPGGTPFYIIHNPDCKCNN